MGCVEHVWEPLSKTRATEMADYRNGNLAIVATKKREKCNTGAPRSTVHTHDCKNLARFVAGVKGAFVEAVYLITSL